MNKQGFYVGKAGVFLVVLLIINVWFSLFQDIRPAANCQGVASAYHSD
jgi:hypothetical protein